MNETTTTENPYYSTHKHHFEPMPSVSVACRWCGHGTAYPLHCNVPAPQPEPDAGEEWHVRQVLPGEPRAVFDNEGRLVATAISGELAAVMVADHTRAALVPGLVEALKGVAIMLNTELERYESEPWAQRVHAALALVKGRE